MNEWAAVLDELVADAPLERKNWRDVVKRSRRFVRPHKRLVLALAAVLAFAVVGTAVGIGVDLLRQQETFHANLPDDPQRIGPFVEIVSGDEWALIAWRSEDGICLDFAIPGNSPFGCGFPVPPHAVAGFFSGGNLVGGDGKATIFGVAAHDVGRVDVELRDGRVVDAPLYDAPPALSSPLRFFIVRLAIGELERRQGTPVRAYSAYDRDGNLIEHAED